MRHQQQGEPVAPPVPVEDIELEHLDQTPPPDHDDFMATSARGLRAIRERREQRRRKKP